MMLRPFPLALKIAGAASAFILTLFYFLVVAPHALAVRAFSDPLRIKTPPKDSMWTPIRWRIAGRDESRRQS